MGLIHSASRNDLAEHEAVIDRALAELAEAGISPQIAMLAADLDRAGWTVRQPRWRGARWYFTDPAGVEWSLSGLLEALRGAELVRAECVHCGGPRYIAQGEQRGPRLDRRYCSNACRQAAYRARKSAS